MYKTNKKVMTIKEYKKNYKCPPKNKEKDNLNNTQNIFLYKILKNKKYNGNISIDLSINKTTENTFQKDETRQKVINVLNKKNCKIPKKSITMTPSDSHANYFCENNKHNLNKEENFNSSLNNKKFYLDSKASNSRKNVIKQYKAKTPVENHKNNKQIKYNIEDKKSNGESIYKNKNHDNSNQYSNYNINHNHINYYNEKKELISSNNNRIYKK